MQKVIILQGTPASGKSTWAKAYCTKNKDWIRVSRDDLRHMRGKYWIPKQEGLITKMERSLIKDALDSGFNVIVDSMNLNTKHLESLKTYIKQCSNIEPSIELKRFEVPFEVALERDTQRANGVGYNVLKDLYDKYINPPVEPIIQDSSLPKAIICDIDGTVAKMVERRPYDWNRVGEDEPKENIINIVKMYHDFGYNIIFFTGRDGNAECKRQTIEWLEKHLGLEHENDFQLFIRTENDNRKDSIIKKEMFEENIRNKYFIDLVIDDRLSVTEMWRNELGLTCLQVDWGRF